MVKAISILPFLSMVNILFQFSLADLFHDGTREISNWDKLIDLMIELHLMLNVITHIRCKVIVVCRFKPFFDSDHYRPLQILMNYSYYCSWSILHLFHMNHWQLIIIFVSNSWQRQYCCKKVNYQIERIITRRCYTSLKWRCYTSLKCVKYLLMHNHYWVRYEYTVWM